MHTEYCDITVHWRVMLQHLPCEGRPYGLSITTNLSAARHNMCTLCNSVSIKLIQKLNTKYNCYAAVNATSTAQLCAEKLNN